MDFIKHKYREEHLAVENSEECKRWNLKRSTWECFPGQRISVDGSRRKLFVHETMATDTDNIKKVFDAVKVSFLHITTSNKNWLTTLSQFECVRKLTMGIGVDLPSAEVFQWRADFPISENHHGQNPGPVWGKLSGLKDYLDMFLKIVFVVFQFSTHPASIHFSSHWSELLHACICWTANVTKINYDM